MGHNGHYLCAILALASKSRDGKFDKKEAIFHEKILSTLHILVYSGTRDSNNRKKAIDMINYIYI